MGRTLKIALAGNPNSGKTSIFNQLAGAHQHVANYPGVTVEIKRALIQHEGLILEFVDLPGTYALSSISEEEIISRDYLVNERPDIVINVVDACTLERQLYLTTQLIELELPIILALNMTDEAKRLGIEFDIPLLSRLLGMPIVPTVGTSGEGIDELLKTIVEVASKNISIKPRQLTYGRILDAEIESLCSFLQANYPDSNLLQKVPIRWLAIRLLESDPEVTAQLEKSGAFTRELRTAVNSAREKLQRQYSDPPEIIIAEARYGVISGAASEAIRRTVEQRHDRSDQLDTIFLSPVLGIPIFLALMFSVFFLTFRIGNPISDLLESGFSRLASSIGAIWHGNDSSPLESLITDGIIGGVGGVIVFLPNILILFLAIAFLEDSGYMARAAFIMDRAMHTIGLHGKSCIPMLLGFGCSVPAIMGTRILENRRDRLVTILVIPLMSCSARLPTYSLIIPAFFPEKLQGAMLWLIYVIGIVLAVILTKLLRTTIFKGEDTPFIMELPPYRMPTLKGLMIHAWERGSGYLKKAGTIILAISIILWWATTYPTTHDDRYGNIGNIRNQLSESESQFEKKSNSYIGKVAKAIEPGLKTMGFDWRIGTALMGAVAAKEVFVAQLGIIFSTDDDSEGFIKEKIQKAYSPLTGFCVMLFILIGLPCMATVAVTRYETGSWGWAMLQWGGLTLIAWIITTLVFQIGSLMGWGAQ